MAPPWAASKYSASCPAQLGARLALNMIQTLDLLLKEFLHQVKSGPKAIRLGDRR